MSRLTAVLALLLLTGLGCHQPRYSWVYDKHVDFSRLKTYTWLKGVEQGTAMRDIGGKSMDQLMTEFVDRELAAKGFTRAAEGGQVDFTVKYRSVLEFRSAETSGGAVDDEPALFGGERYENVSPAPTAQPGVPSSYSVGTIYLSIRRPGSDEVLWRGVAEAVLREKAEPESRLKRLAEAVQKILSNFPPGKRN
jgi:hypothetical protein